MKFALIWLCIFLGGCITYRDKNAPGHAKIAERPRDISHQGVQVPDDPGQYLLRGGFRASSMMGGLWTDEETLSTLRLSGQFSLGLMELENSLPGGSELWILVTPKGHFAALGWDFLVIDDIDYGDARMGAIYAQWQYRSEFFVESSIALGFAYNPFTGAYGPVLTSSILFLNHIRFGYLRGEGFHLGYGFGFDVPHGWVWSR